MKKRLSLLALSINFILAFTASFVFAQAVPSVEFNPVVSATVITLGYAAITYFVTMPKGILQEGLQTEVWIADIKEQPLPDTSFITQSQDLSAFVRNNILHLAEAGVDPDVFLNYFTENNEELPIQDINDIPHEVILQIWSTAQTKHNNLLDAELSYDKRASILNRHRNALAKNMAQRTAFSWSAASNDAFNKIINLGANDSVIDAFIDMRAFMKKLDIDMSTMNVILQSDHEARIQKEDKKLYKEIISEKGATLYDFKIHSYSKTPYYTAAGAKKPWGSTIEATDKQASNIWSSEEVFRCTGDVEVYPTLKHSGWQSDLFSMGQRALNGKIRSNAPKYFGAIL
ncbi:hypothetical protein OMO38_10315 [Chryseobacterium sp. 09-1422]|uniref:Uncharacterized protein n=1 Tax=Chryseobacterium kimseyorum TaxID=2984028 RepID=A0ABT3HYN3_9FLAO|nr:hypothetical protein [Chryseobacterium kimseyorum]MCW3168915.1 hypothetical protein [Chryseobacterium kimseyorum]